MEAISKPNWIVIIMFASVAAGLLYVAYVRFKEATPATAHVNVNGKDISILDTWHKGETIEQACLDAVKEEEAIRGEDNSPIYLENAFLIKVGRNKKCGIKPVGV